MHKKVNTCAFAIGSAEEWFGIGSGGAACKPEMGCGARKGATIERGVGQPGTPEPERKGGSGGRTTLILSTVGG